MVLGVCVCGGGGGIEMEVWRQKFQKKVVLKGGGGEGCLTSGWSLNKVECKVFKKHNRSDFPKGMS